MATLRNTAVIVGTAALCLAFGYGAGVHLTAAPAPAAGKDAASTGTTASRSLQPSGLLTPPPASSKNPTLTANLIPDIVKVAEPAVVTIFTKVPGSVQGQGFFYSQTPAESGIGSGFIINPSGYILTNDHVIAGASSIQVKVNGYSKRFTASVVGADYGLDLALIKIKAPKALPTLPLGNFNSVPIGAFDVAIGSPEGLENTVTVGVVSARGRSFTIGSRNYKDLLQTDAPINPGNSGGPLLNLQGQVIGINTAVNTSGQGLGFAIPINAAEKELGALMSQHLQTKGYLGVEIATNTPSLASENGLSVNHGVVVVSVSAGGPAEAAGFQPGDVIVAVDGKSVSTAQQLTKIIEADPPGTVVHFTVVRGSGRITLTATLAQRPTSAT
jgi:serine protease Do